MLDHKKEVRIYLAKINPKLHKYSFENGKLFLNFYKDILLVDVSSENIILFKLIIEIVKL